MIIAHANWPTLLKPGIRDKRKPKSAIKKVKAIPKSHNCVRRGGSTNESSIARLSPM